MSLRIYFEGMDILPDMPIERDVEGLFTKKPGLHTGPKFEIIIPNSKLEWYE